MSADTINRFDRIVAILIQLQSKRIVKAQELADRFQVSLRTIYRDIRSLESSGIPIISESGVGYSLMNGYRLPPVMFTREEASSFVAAEKLMQKFTDKTIGTHYQSAMYKIKSVLKGKEKDWITTLESQVMISPSEGLFNDNIPDALEILFECIVEKKQVLLNYQSFHADQPTERRLEPIGLFHENGCWYMMAYCHLRNDYRQFRTDRIEAINRTDILFTKEHGNINDYRTKDDQEKITVKIALDKNMAKYIKGARKYYGFVSEKIVGDQIEMTFSTCDLKDGFARWYIMFGDFATILEPKELKDYVKQLLIDNQARLED